MPVPKRKRLYCSKCKSVRWAVPIDGPNYECKCGAPINLYDAKRTERNKKRHRSEAKQKAKGIFKTKKAKATERKEKRRDCDQDYLRWIHGFFCVNPECGHWPVDAHHVDLKSQLGSDRSSVPLCHECHMRYHQELGSIEAAFKEWGINLEAFVVALNAAYERGDEPPMIDHVPIKDEYHSS